MILTVTMNPSIDTSYRLDHLSIDDVNRVDALKTAGGKGLNVTRVVAQLGDEVVATGVAGGRMGAFIEDRLDEEGIRHEFSPIAGESRVCVAVMHDGGKQTELLERGPEVTRGEQDAFLGTFDRLAARAACITISGSLPRGIDKSLYVRLVATANRRDVPVLLDSSGRELSSVVGSDSRPFLVKPNLAEMRDLLGRELPEGDVAGLAAALGDSRLSGIEWVVVSLGGDGAVARHGGRLYRVRVPRIEVVSPVGSGDSTIAGFAHAAVAGMSDVDLLRSGMTCGMLNAMEPLTGHIDASRFDELSSRVEVAEL